MAVTRQMLLSELKDLLRLTAFEQTVATVRRAQARTTPIERELAENAKKAGERLDLLKSAVASVGGVPDVVTPAVGRFGAFVQSQLNQVQTLQGALLGDLALEHQLRERTRYARTLAQSLGETQVLPVLDRLETAHSATISWLETRLAEVGRTGTSALRATPVQAAVGLVRRSAQSPLGLAATGVNRVSGLVGKVTGKAPASLQDALAQAVQAGQDAAREASDRVIDLTQRGAGAAEHAAQNAGEQAGHVAEQVRDTAEDAVEQVRDTAEDAVEQVEQTAEQVAEQAERITEQVLEATGGADVADEKPPFAGYDAITGDSVMRHVADTEDVEELRTLLAYEQAHKARKGVLKAAQERLEELGSLAS
jgi:bacterioferritin (cytochrome b1)